MKQYKIYLGLTTGDGLVQIPYNAAVLTVKKLMKDKGLSGATCYAADGIWENEQEKSMVIELISGTDSEYFQDTVTVVAKELKAFYKQHSVLITSQDIEVWEA